MAEVEFSTVNRYEEWLRSEGVPVVRGFHVEDVNTMELGPWPRKGGLGTYINIEGGGRLTDAYVSEIPPGASLNPEKHLFEEVIYILKGMGSASVWNEGSPRQTFEWGEGSLFTIPLNAWHQLFNGSGSSPARYLAVTNAIRMINLFRNLDFVFDNPFVFRDRFLGEEDYWNSHGTVGRMGKRHIWDVNFVPDSRNLKIPPRPDRGPVGRMHFLMAQSDLSVHVAEHPAGGYAKAHRHGAGVHILTLASSGYTLLWLEGQERRKLDWKPGTLFAPPDRWFHQHFNTSDIPERSLRVGGVSKRYLTGPDTSNVDMKEGGNQIEYEDEDPEIRQMFEAELAKTGSKSSMTAVLGQN